MRDTGTPVPLRFDEVTEAPAEPGVYAWYHQIQLSSADVSQFKATVSSGSDEDRRSHAHSFFLEHVFGPYRETDYDVAMSGQLKPEYRGSLSHRPHLSESLLSLATNAPDSLDDVRSILARTVPFFASPIYIGLATGVIPTY
jgi:hypothetical protein